MNFLLQGMGDFLDEMLTMMSQTKSNVSHLVRGVFGDKAMQLKCFKVEDLLAIRRTEKNSKERKKIAKVKKKVKKKHAYIKSFYTITKFFYFSYTFIPFYLS